MTSPASHSVSRELRGFFYVLGNEVLPRGGNPIFSGYSAESNSAWSCNPIFSGYSAESNSAWSCNPIFETVD
jgi:hypothetical protein